MCAHLQVVHSPVDQLQVLVDPARECVLLDLFPGRVLGQLALHLLVNFLLGLVELLLIIVVQVLLILLVLLLLVQLLVELLVERLAVLLVLLVHHAIWVNRRVLRLLASSIVE